MDELGCVLWIFWLPYQLWKWMTESSRLGTSRMDREAGELWRNFAIVGTALALIAGGVIWWLWG